MHLVMSKVMTPYRWAATVLLLGATWVLGVLAAGFLLNRVIAISQISDVISARQVVEAKFVQAVRDSVRGQFRDGPDDKRFFVLEARAKVQAESLVGMVVGDDRETMIRFLNLHDQYGEECRRKAGCDGLGAKSLKLEYLLDEVAQHLAERREAEKAALRASLEKSGLCFGIAVLFVSVVYFLVAGVLARMRREIPFRGGLGDGLPA